VPPLQSHTRSETSSVSPAPRIVGGIPLLAVQFSACARAKEDRKGPITTRAHKMSILTEPRLSKSGKLGLEHSLPLPDSRGSAWRQPLGQQRVILSISNSAFAPQATYPGITEYSWKASPEISQLLLLLLPK